MHTTACISEFFFSIFEKQERKYEQNPTICNTVRFNMTDEKVKKNPENYLLLKQEELLVQEVKKYLSPSLHSVNS